MFMHPQYMHGYASHDAHSFWACATPRRHRLSAATSIRQPDLSSAIPVKPKPWQAGILKHANAYRQLQYRHTHLPVVHPSRFLLMRDKHLMPAGRPALSLRSAFAYAPMQAGGALSSSFALYLVYRPLRSTGSEESF